MKSKKGSSIFLVLIILSMFFIMVMALLKYSRGEMRQVKQQVGHQSAEIIALSGIDYVEGRLRKNRWYQQPFSQDGSEGRPTGIVESVTPPGGEGSLTIACQDVANKTPVSNIFGMQQLWLLHHVDVFSLAEYGGKKCLVYGRFIVSPEPALNSDSTDGIIYSDPAYSPFEVRMEVPRPSTGEEAEFILKNYNVYPGQEVDLNTVVAELDRADGSATGIPVYASSHGKIKSLSMSSGDSCKSGDELVAIEKNPGHGSPANLKTLKKMVRITKIDLGRFPDFYISNLSDRYAVSSFVAQTSDAFLLNFVSHKKLEEQAEAIKNENLPEKLSDNELLELFPPEITNMTRERAENLFLAYLLQKFVPPGTNWEKKDEAQKKAYLKLDHVKTEPPQEMVDFLAKNGIQWTLNSKPRIDPRYYEPKMYKAEFLNLLSPQLNLPVSQFIEQLSWLPDATRAFEVQENEGGFGEGSTIREDDNSIYIVKDDADPYPIKLQIQKIKKSYSYVDPVNNFAIQMQDLVDFFRKYYSSENADFPKEEERYLANIDWPLPDEPGPAPSPPEGYRSVWIPGTPGVPPGPPTWDYEGGEEVEIPYPTGSSRTYEPSGGDPNGGEKTYPISTDETGSDGDGDFSDGVAITEPEAPFSTSHPPITYEDGGEWEGSPGTPGIPPTQGKWEFEKLPDPPQNDGGSTDHECTTCCFAVGTRIEMADGSFKNIEDVIIGDLVKSYDPNQQKFVEGRVTALESPVRNHLTTIKFQNGDELKLTNEHPLYTEKGWASIDPEATMTDHGMKVKTLRVGQQVRHIAKGWLRVGSIFTKTSRQKVYNLASVEPYSTYIAGGVVAHNKPDSEFSDDDPGTGGGGGAGENTADGDAGSDPTGAGGSSESGGGPGGGSGNNTTGGGGGPGGGSAGGGGDGSASNTNGGDGGSSSSGSPGGGSGDSTNNTGSNSPGGSSSNTGSGSTGGGGGSSYPSGGGSYGGGGGSPSSYSSSSSFSI